MSKLRRQQSEIWTEHTFEESLMMSVTDASGDGRASRDPVNAHRIDIAKEVFPLPLLFDEERIICEKESKK